MPIGGIKNEDQDRMTSKYSLNIEPQKDNYQEPESSRTKLGKNLKTLKFKEESLSQRNNSGDLHDIPTATEMKSKLNDSSSAQLGFGKHGIPNETGNFGQNTEKRNRALPAVTSSTLPDIKNFYHQ